jgi:hypothetical protein
MTHPNLSFDGNAGAPSRAMSRLHAAERLIVLSLVLGVHPGYTQFGRLSPGQLEDLVARIALYPDPLLAQVLAASTYWDEIPQATACARQHSYLTAEALAEAIREDNLPWHPSVIALLPFPSVLEMMAQDPAWLKQLGTAVLTQPDEVMDAIQRLRRKALQFGYLRSNNYITVNVTQENIEILPATPGVIYVHTYDPLVLFAAPKSGLVAGETIRFRPAVQDRSCIWGLGMDGSRNPVACALHHARSALGEALGGPGTLCTPVLSSLGPPSRPARGTS